MATAGLLIIVSFVFAIVAAVLVGRLVKDANATRDVEMVANPARVQMPTQHQPAGDASIV